MVTPISQRPATTATAQAPLEAAAAKNAEPRLGDAAVADGHALLGRLFGAFAGTDSDSAAALDNAQGSAEGRSAFETLRALLGTRKTGAAEAFPLDAADNAFSTPLSPAIFAELARLALADASATPLSSALLPDAERLQGLGEAQEKREGNARHARSAESLLAKLGEMKPDTLLQQQPRYLVLAAQAALPALRQALRPLLLGLARPGTDASDVIIPDADVLAAEGAFASITGAAEATRAEVAVVASNPVKLRTLIAAMSGAVVEVDAATRGLADKLCAYGGGPDLATADIDMLVYWIMMQCGESATDDLRQIMKELQGNIAAKRAQRERVQRMKTAKAKLDGELGQEYNRLRADGLIDASVTLDRYKEWRPVAFTIDGSALLLPVDPAQVSDLLSSGGSGTSGAELTAFGGADPSYALLLAERFGISAGDVQALFGVWRKGAGKKHPEDTAAFEAYLAAGDKPSLKKGAALRAVGEPPDPAIVTANQVALDALVAKLAKYEAEAEKDATPASVTLDKNLGNAGAGSSNQQQATAAADPTRNSTQNASPNVGAIVEQLNVSRQAKAAEQEAAAAATAAATAAAGESRTNLYNDQCLIRRYELLLLLKEVGCDVSAARDATLDELKLALAKPLTAADQETLGSWQNGPLAQSATLAYELSQLHGYVKELQTFFKFEAERAGRGIAAAVSGYGWNESGPLVLYRPFANGQFRDGFSDVGYNSGDTAVDSFSNGQSEEITWPDFSDAGWMYPEMQTIMRMIPDHRVKDSNFDEFEQALLKKKWKYEGQPPTYPYEGPGKVEATEETAGGSASDLAQAPPTPWQHTLASQWRKQRTSDAQARAAQAHNDGLRDDKLRAAGSLLAGDASFPGSAIVEQGNMALFAAKIESAEQDLDSIGDVSDLMQTRLQLAMDRRQKAIETLSNLMKKVSSTQAEIIANLK